MLQGQALGIVLKMAKERCWNESATELEAIAEVESLLTQFEDTGSYTEDDYMDD